MEFFVNKNHESKINSKHLFVECVKCEGINSKKYQIVVFSARSEAKREKKFVKKVKVKCF